MVYQLEAAQSQPFLNSEANWTATYRRDSTVVTPYGWWEGEEEVGDEGEGAGEDLSVGREGRAAWLVSNCDANNARLEYAEALAKYFPVDIIGKCGQQLSQCSRVGELHLFSHHNVGIVTQGKPEECWKTLAKKYKFYLSFENSNCIDYISEKFWQALRHKVR